MVKHLSFAKTWRTCHIRQNILIVIIFHCLLNAHNSFAQSQPWQPTYPKIVGYLSFILPIVSMDKNATTTNFTSYTSIGFPTGINVLYSNRFGFSYEITPTIKATGSSSKMSNLLFDPGPMFRFEHGFTIIPRLAFETSGRYGFTPVFNQVIKRTKAANYFMAVSLPARFGNSQASSIGTNIQFGLIFN